MSKVVNKICVFFVVFAMVLCGGFLLTGCQGSSASRILNLSINPSIELLLDSNNKVISVNANNDEGNFIILNASFIGKNAEEAVELFLQVNYENGFVVKRNAGENHFNIEVSGSDAQKFFNNLKQKANEFISTIDADIQVNLNEILNREYLEELVEECRKELSDAEIERLSQQELLNLIQKSRDETKSFFTEELKELYYRLRAEEIVKEKFNAIKTEISNLFNIQGIHLNEIQEVFATNFSTFTTNLENFKSQFENVFLNESSKYQQALKDYIHAKKEMLEANLSGEIDERLEETLINVENALVNAENMADSLLEEFEDAIEDAIEVLDSTLNTIINFLNQKNINKAIENAQKDFNKIFKEEFSDFISDSCWNDLKPNK